MAYYQTTSTADPTVSGVMALGVVSVGAPYLVDGQVGGLSLDTDGRLRVLADAGAAETSAGVHFNRLILRELRGIRELLGLAQGIPASSFEALPNL